MAILSTTIVVASVLASAALAAPFGHPNGIHGLRARSEEVVTITDWVTVSEQATVWVDGNGVPVSTEYASGAVVATTSTADSSATTSASSTATTTSSDWPAGFNSEPLTRSTAAYSTVAVSSTPTSTLATSTYAPATSAAVTSSTSATSVASTTSAAAATTTSSSSSAATETTAAATTVATSTTNTASSTTSSSTSTSTGVCVGSDSDCVGDITHWDGGLGACGWDVDTSSDLQVALPYALMGTESNDNPYCGMSLTIVSTSGDLVQATVGDKCMGCSDYSIDLTDILFTTVAPDGDGRVSGIQWYFN